MSPLFLKEEEVTGLVSVLTMLLSELSSTNAHANRVSIGRHLDI